MWTATSVLVSWATCDAIIGPNAVPNPPLGISSVVRYGVDRRNLNMTATGVVTGYTSNYSSVGFEVYVSPVLHHTLLKGGCGGRELRARPAAAQKATAQQRGRL